MLTQIHNILSSRVGCSDPKDVVFNYQEQWERNFLRKNKEKKKDRRPVATPAPPPAASQVPPKKLLQKPAQKHKKRCPANKQPEPVRTCMDLNSEISQGIQEVEELLRNFKPPPYRPKGGYVTDPELTAKGQFVPEMSHAVPRSRNTCLSHVSIQASTHVCPNLFSYHLLHVHCEVQNDSGQMSD